MSRATKAGEEVAESAQEMVARLVNRRTGFLIQLSETEKATLRAAAGDEPLSAWIRETCLTAAARQRK